MEPTRTPAGSPPGARASDSRFGRLLRFWRERRGLSQLQLALDAEASQRHVSFLETGRSRPSREMVLRLGAALQMPLREQNRLLEVAGHQGGFAERTLDDPALQPVRQVLDRMLEALEPYPVLVVDAQWNLLQSNAGAGRLLRRCLAPEALAAFSGGAEGPPNLMRLMIDPRGLRACTRNWDQVAAVTALRIERELAEVGGDDATRALLERMKAELGPFERRRLAMNTEPAPPVLSLALEVPGFRVNLFSTIATLGTAQDVTLQELRIESFFPADAASEQTLRQLAREEEETLSMPSGGVG